MRTIIKSTLIVLCLSGLSLVSNAQNFTVTGEYRPRVEHHNIVLSPESDPINLVTQRTRLKFDYADTLRGFRTRLTLQDARTWGNTDQFAVKDNITGIMPYEAWIELNFTKNLSLKLGRQVIIYDDQRIFGENDFQQQSRSHDAAVIKYEGGFKLHIGAAYNNDTVPLEFSDQAYALNSYKTMQYIHFHKKMRKVDLSLLALNNGIELISNEGNKEIVYSQTIGFHSGFKIKKGLKATLLGYYQTGKDHKKRDLSAYNIKAGLEYMAIPRRLLIKGGYEVFSGNDQSTNMAPGGENKSFSFMYGSIIKNMGINSMYSFAPPKGNVHSVNYGISNTTLDILFFANKKLTFRNRTMLVGSLEKIAGPTGIAGGKHLGVENDFFIRYKMNDQVSFRGLAAVFAMSDNLKKLPHPLFELSTFKGTQQWFSLSCIVTPTFFKR